MRAVVETRKGQRTCGRRIACPFGTTRTEAHSSVGHLTSMLLGRICAIVALATRSSTEGSVFRFLQNSRVPRWTDIRFAARFCALCQGPSSGQIAVAAPAKRPRRGSRVQDLANRVLPFLQETQSQISQKTCKHYFVFVNFKNMTHFQLTSHQDPSRSQFSNGDVSGIRNPINFSRKAGIDPEGQIL